MPNTYISQVASGPHHNYYRHVDHTLCRITFLRMYGHQEEMRVDGSHPACSHVHQRVSKYQSPSQDAATWPSQRQSHNQQPPNACTATTQLLLPAAAVPALLVSGTCTFLSSLKAGPYCSPDAASCWYSCTVSRGTVALALCASMLRSDWRRDVSCARASSACERAGQTDA